MTFKEKVDELVKKINDSKNKLETAYMLVVTSVPENPPQQPLDQTSINNAEQLLIYGKRFTNNYAELLLLLLQKTKDKSARLASIRTQTCSHYFVEYELKGHTYVLDPSQEEIIEGNCAFRYFMLNGPQLSALKNENYKFMDFDLYKGPDADFFTTNWQFCETPECVKACFGVILQNKPQFSFYKCKMDPKTALKHFVKNEKSQNDLEMVQIEKFLIREEILFLKFKFVQNSKIAGLMKSLKGFIGSVVPIDIQ